MDIIYIFYAVVGSILAECAAAYHFFCRSQRLPARYRKGSFYVVRATIALGAGILPAVFAVQTAPAAFALGVGAPLIINQLSRGFNPSN
jgi:hypothetical protein